MPQDSQKSKILSEFWSEQTNHPAFEPSGKMIVLDQPKPPIKEKTMNLPWTFFLSQKTPVGPFESSHPETFALGRVKADNFNSQPSILLNALLLLDSTTLNRKAPPSPLKNSKNLPSTLIEAYTTSSTKKREGS